MKVALYYRFGAPEVVEPSDVEKPAVPDDGVLVRVRASSVNPADWYPMMGRPYIARATFGMRKPKESRLGIDYAGMVESVGNRVTMLRPGDDVFGGRTGALAECVCTPDRGAIALKPANVTFEACSASACRRVLDEERRGRWPQGSWAASVLISQATLRR